MFLIPPKLNNKLFKELPESLSKQFFNNHKKDIENIINSSIQTELKLVELEKKRKNKLKKLKFIRKIKTILRNKNELDQKKAIYLFVEYYLREINAGFRAFLFSILELIF
jgi:hypothetical protein